MAFFKSLLTRGYRKHERLETRILCGDDEDYEFKVHYLGDTPISEASNKKSTSHAVRNIVQMTKLDKAEKDKSKHSKVTLAINSAGVRIQLRSSLCLLDIPLTYISYCSADAKFSKVFAFVAVDTRGDLKCYAFECDSRKEAREISTTLNKVFQSAFLHMKIDENVG